MMMKVVQKGLALAAIASLSACDQNARSQQYFEAHLAEAEKIVADCRTGAVRGEECSSADLALRIAKGAKLHRQNFGTAKQPNFGDGY